MRAIDHARMLFEHIDLHKPPVDLDSIAEKLGVKIFFEDFEKIDGIALKSPKSGIIVVNKNLPDTRIRFTIAHELGHLVMPHKGKYYICYPGMNKVMERNADRFAAELLMPVPMLEMLWKKFATNAGSRVEIVANVLKVSKSALFARLRETGIK
jgi:Zn-dependent peptidase ImmA (M78 family)